MGMSCKRSRSSNVGYIPSSVGGPGKLVFDVSFDLDKNPDGPSVQLTLEQDVVLKDFLSGIAYRKSSSKGV